jgi:hypothetical protein
VLPSRQPIVCHASSGKPGASVFDRASLVRRVDVGAERLGSRVTARHGVLLCCLLVQPDRPSGTVPLKVLDLHLQRRIDACEAVGKVAIGAPSGNRANRRPSRVEQFAPLGCLRATSNPALGLVGDQDIAGHLQQQGIGADEVMDLSSGEHDAQRITERVDESVDLGAQSALAATGRLIIIFFWVRRRYAGGPARWCYRSSHIRCPRRRPSAPTLAAICPFSAQRLNRRCVFFQSPKSSGRSRQGMPAQYRKRTASRESAIIVSGDAGISGFPRQ